MAKAPKTTTAPTGQIPPFGLRMLPELKEKVEASARANGRSMNAEIVARLEQTFGPITAVANQLVEPASQVATARVVSNDDLTAAVADAVRPAMERMREVERTNTILALHLLREQKRSVEDRLSRLHDPLGNALIDLERVSGDGSSPEVIEAKRQEAHRLRERMAALDAEIDDLKGRIEAQVKSLAGLSGF